jgi:hypothetical protein
MNLTRLILDALRKRHDEQRNGLSRAWIFAEEVRVSTGFTHLASDEQVDDTIRLGGEQSIDAFAFHTWPSEKYRRVAYEVKASRSDLKRELDQPFKCAAALALSNEFYLVAPTDVLIGGITDHFPETWGVMSYHKGRIRTIKRALWRDTPLPPYSFMLSLARNLQASPTVE